MDKEFVPYELAVKLKKLEFDEPCLTCYDKLEMIASHSKNVFDYKNYNTSGYMVSRPTFSQVFRWFREKYGLPSHIATYWQHDWNNYSYQYYFVQDKVEWNGIEHYKTYEEAELACLTKLIEIQGGKDE